MKIQSISNLNFQKNILKSTKVSKKVQKTFDPVQDMNRRWTQAAIAVILLEAGMLTAAYFKNKEHKEPEPQKIEVPTVDAKRPQQNTLWIDL